MGPAEFIIHGENGILVEPRNAAALEEAMRQMKEDNELRHQLGENVYTHTIHHFERSIMVERILNDRKELSEKGKL